jgi:hypothetical protein
MKPRWLITVLVFAATGSMAAANTGIAANEAAPAAEMSGLPLVLHEDFQRGNTALERFEFDDPHAWKIIQDGDRTVLAQFKQADYKPPVRSPRNRAWVRDLIAGPFVIELRVRSTTRDYHHRDIVVFFGGVDDRHFYYAHLGKVADANSHQIMVVDNAPRAPVTTRRTNGTPWTDGYHTVRVVRNAAGATEVFFDGQSVLYTEDNRFPAGRLGIGTFDDTAHFDSITIWAEKKKPE